MSKRFKMKPNSGWAYDEMALAAAMLSSVGAFGVVAVPWDVVLKSGTQQLMEQIEVVETANAAFYDRYRLWPHQVTNGDWSHNAAVLIDQSAMKFPYNTMRGYERLLPESQFKPAEGNAVSIQHNIGDGGRVLQRVARGQDGRTYLEVIFENVPLTEARKVDQQVDGRYDPQGGRVTFEFTDTIVRTDKVSLKYRANAV
mgnify:CR=1 FL=1|tara:strand:+ start:2962 stop:3558 length:597 start_codon:yes stop_codon:yes gene_type:complete